MHDQNDLITKKPADTDISMPTKHTLHKHTFTHNTLCGKYSAP